MEDFKTADKILLFSILAGCVIVALVTPWQHGYFTLGLVGGGIVAAVCVFAYKTLAGTPICRIIMASALTVLLVITVQQSNGLGEGHFLFFLGFTILIRYRDIAPLLVFVGLTVVHHVTFTYCQSIGVELWGRPLLIFSWGGQTDLGLLAPFIYHVVFAVLALLISTYYIYEGNVKFVESNLVIIAVEKAANGDLTTRISNEEANSELIEHVNEFLERLHKTFAQIGKVAKTLTSNATQTIDASLQRTQRASDQQSEVSQVASAVNEMSAATLQIAESAEKTAHASNTTVTTSNTGGEIAETCQQSIIKLAQQVEQATKIISELDKNSHEISSIVQTISGIAEQTNLLALNAAIEAARAGEQGRGFAVVADEVRVLSKRTHSSTEEITAMITALQSSTQSAVETMDGCHELANISVSDAKKATDSFKEIAASVDAISDMATQIATAVEQQSLVTEEINRNTNSINDSSVQFLGDVKKGHEEANTMLEQARLMTDYIGHFMQKSTA
ncbi:methyl-accepting chemotaxis protein [Alteromonas gracilis]|uniref:methyl-accepting chemotaxis protein n=1 Tax=Alteromonas gracilis TaxID=1479524 RepID=UPI003736A0D0